MKRSSLLMTLVIGLGVCAGWTALADPLPIASTPKTNAPANETETDKWMGAKLHNTQEIFDGLMHADFNKVEDHARRLLILDILEQWSRKEKFTRLSDYEGQLNAFEFSTKELVRQARDQNMDGALQSYLNLSQSCVRCHQLIRDQPAAK